MPRLYLIFLSSFIFLMLLSCSITWHKHVYIQVLNPSDIILPVNINKIHILNPCHQQIFENRIESKCLNHTIFDSILKQSFEQSPTFKNTAFVIQNEKEINSELRSKPSGKHVLLTLNYYIEIDTSDFESHAEYYCVGDPDDYILIKNDGNYKLKYDSKVELTDFTTKKVFDTFEYADSSY